MGVHIGGKDSYRQFEKGEVICSLQWVNDEPAMILWPKVRRTLGAGAFVVCLSAAFQYVKSDGHPIAEYLIPQSIKAAKVMGLEPHSFTVKAIADIILEHITDLVAMPPTPADWKEKKVEEAIGEMSLKVDGETIAERDVTVPEALA